MIVYYCDSNLDFAQQAPSLTNRRFCSSCRFTLHTVKHVGVKVMSLLSTAPSLLTFVFNSFIRLRSETNINAGSAATVTMSGAGGI